MRGVDKIVVRTKSGPSREKIQKSPSFVMTRRNNAEFGGRATATKWLMPTGQARSRNAKFKDDLSELEQLKKMASELK